MIPFMDLNIQHKKIEEELQVAISEVIKRGDFILGEELRLFEKEFAQFCQGRYALGVSSGTDALFLALSSLGIGTDDEVVVPAFTYIATALAVSYTQAKPVFVDIEEASYNLDVKKLKSAITPKTKAIIPVHLYGQPANMQEILKVARENNLKVIEDTAQAHGARLKLKGGPYQRAGSIGDIGCFSFYPSKNLGCMGDGGMILTNSEEIYKKLLMLRDYGRISKYAHVIIGYNCRLDTLQAAILRVKLKNLESWNKLRQEAASLYNQQLNGLDEIITPAVSDFSEHVYHVYAIRSKKRDFLMEELKNKGISVLVHYPIPLHLQKAYQELGYKKGDFPVAEKVSQEILSLPIFPFISAEQIKFVCAAIKKALAK